MGLGSRSWARRGYGRRVRHRAGEAPRPAPRERHATGGTAAGEAPGPAPRERVGRATRPPASTSWTARASPGQPHPARTARIHELVRTGHQRRLTCLGRPPIHVSFADEARLVDPARRRSRLPALPPVDRVPFRRGILLLRPRRVLHASLRSRVARLRAPLRQPEPVVHPDRWRPQQWPVPGRPPLRRHRRPRLSRSLPVRA